MQGDHMTDMELNELARGWIAYQHDRKNEDTWEAWNRSSHYMDEAVESRPLEAWKMILAIHALDQSLPTQQVLSAGPIEDLLVKHGDVIIPLVEAQAGRDAIFAKLLGGVWKNRMADEIWARVQAVWDRRGWDGIPE
jgi:hypothetical protein